MELKNAKIVNEKKTHLSKFKKLLDQFASTYISAKFVKFYR